VLQIRFEIENGSPGDPPRAVLISREVLAAPQRAWRRWPFESSFVSIDLAAERIAVNAQEPRRHGTDFPFIRSSTALDETFFSNSTNGLGRIESPALHHLVDRALPIDPFTMAHSAEKLLGEGPAC